MKDASIGDLAGILLHSVLCQRAYVCQKLMVIGLNRFGIRAIPAKRQTAIWLKFDSLISLADTHPDVEFRSGAAAP